MIRGLLLSLLVTLTLSALAAKPSKPRPGGGSDRLATVLAPRSGSAVTTPVEVQIAFDKHADPATLHVVLNGKDITRWFGGLKDTAVGQRHRRIGVRRARLLYGDVKQGPNTLTATVHARRGRRQDADTVAFHANRALGLVDDGTGGGSQVRFITRVPVGDGTYAVQVGNQTYGPPNPGGGALNGYQVLLLDRLDPTDPTKMISNTFYPIAGSGDFQALQNAFSKGVFATPCKTNGCLLIIQSQTTPGYTDPTNDLPGSIFEILGTRAASFFVSNSPDASYSLLATIGLDGNPVAGRIWERVSCQGSAVSTTCASESVVPPFTGTGQITGYLVPDNLNYYVFADPGWTNKVFSTTAGTTNDGTFTPTVPAGCSQGSGNIVMVETGLVVPPVSASYPICLPQGAAGGFQVVTLDRSNDVGLINNQVYTLDAADLSALSGYLDGLDENNLVILVSIGDVARPATPAEAAAFDTVGAALAAMGGTYSLFQGLAAGDDYTFIGAPPPATTLHLSTPPAIEASTIISKATLTNVPIPQSVLNGTLARNTRGYLIPSVLGILAQLTPDRVDSVALEQPHGFPTPQLNDPGQQNAYNWISYCVLHPPQLNNPPLSSCPATPDATVQANCGGVLAFCGDLRANYNDLSVQGDWLTLSLTTLNALAYPPTSSPPNPFFKLGDFTAVQAQLANEFPEVSNVAGFEQLFLDYLDNAFATENATLNDVGNAIEASFSTHTSSPVLTDVVNGVVGILEIVSFLAAAEPGGTAVGEEGSGIGPLTGIIAAVLGTALNIGSQDTGGSPLAQLQTTVGIIAKLQTQLLQEFDDAEGQVAGLFDLILSDWGKLQTVGDGIIAGDPQYQWPANTPSQLDPLLFASLRKQFFTDISAALWYTGHWTDVASGAPPDHPDHAVCRSQGEGEGCFTNGVPAYLKLTEPSGPSSDPASGDGQNYDAWIIGRIQDQGTKFCQIGDDGPSQSVAEAMWAPVDPNDPFSTTGGYGIFQPWFFMRAANQLRNYPIDTSGSSCQ